jgi:hypothetical protein
MITDAFREFRLRAAFLDDAQHVAARNPRTAKPMLLIQRLKQRLRSLPPQSVPNAIMDFIEANRGNHFGDQSFRTGNDHRGNLSSVLRCLSLGSLSPIHQPCSTEPDTGIFGVGLRI